MCCWDPKVRLALWDREKVDSTGSVGRCRRLSLGGGVAARRGRVGDMLSSSLPL